MQIRAAGRGDLGVVLNLYRHLHRHDAPVPEALAAETWAAITADPHMRVFVGEAAGVAVATCTLVIVPNITRACRSFALVENVATRVGYRRRGYGRAVVTHALREAWEVGCYKVMLMAGPSDAARAFYRACGFDGGRKQGFVALAPVGEGQSRSNGRSNGGGLRA